MIIDEEFDDSIRIELIKTSQGPGYCFYGDLYRRYQIDLDNIEGRNSLHQALGRISTREHKQGRPLLSAVVVDKKNKRPGPGFFELAKTLGRYDGPLTGRKSQVFLDAELRSISDYWSTHPLPTSEDSNGNGSTSASDNTRAPFVKSAPKIEQIVLRWEEPGIKNYEDRFPISEFSEECRDERRQHVVVSPNGSSSIAKFRLTVKDRVATLDYGAFLHENRKAGMEIGIMILRFDDPDNMTVKEAYWKPPGKSQSPALLKQVVTYEPIDLPEYSPLKGQSTRADVSIKERPGQAIFRRRLRSAYGNRCCITGCDVPVCLDGAHIDQHENSSHDHPKNGLLLRKDLHALFDAGLLAIEPTGLVIHFKTEVRSFSEYNALHGRKLRGPEKRFSAYTPSPDALSRRWKKFIESENSR
ncbi:MAG: hypothetical protein KCHDKBKB_01056 [Elusimicrobia bacterium]|nr:hypothetical protein [Elusimicrobiota bacterium]